MMEPCAPSRRSAGHCGPRTPSSASPAADQCCPSALSAPSSPSGASAPPCPWDPSDRSFRGLRCFRHAPECRSCRTGAGEGCSAPGDDRLRAGPMQPPMSAASSSRAALILPGGMDQATAKLQRVLAHHCTGCWLASSADGARRPAPGVGLALPGLPGLPSGCRWSRRPPVRTVPRYATRRAATIHCLDIAAPAKIVLARPRDIVPAMVGVAERHPVLDVDVGRSPPARRRDYPDSVDSNSWTRARINDSRSSIGSSRV